MISAGQFSTAMAEVGVSPGDTVYVHAGMQGALRAEGGTPQEKMDTVIAGLQAGVSSGTLMMPTFTYSFCRGEDFDLLESPSTVGMLTEHFRNQPDVDRTPEPIFSSAVHGPVAPEWRARLFGVGDKNCFGEDSVFAYLHDVDAVLLFFGVGFEFCTYLYLIEQRRSVAYRYLKRFAGRVVDADGAATPVAADYLVRDLEADVVSDFDPLAAELRSRGLMAEHRIPRGPRLLAARARQIASVAAEQMAANADYLLARGHPERLEVTT